MYKKSKKINKLNIEIYQAIITDSWGQKYVEIKKELSENNFKNF